jgi:hypothetical protein
MECSPKFSQMVGSFGDSPRPLGEGLGVRGKEYGMDRELNPTSLTWAWNVLLNFLRWLEVSATPLALWERGWG